MPLALSLKKLGHALQLAGLMSLLAVHAPALAQTASPAAPAASVASPKFDIQKITVEGNTLEPQAEIDALLASYIGKNKDFGDVQKALEALEGFYINRGWSAVQVVLPEQEIESGAIKFKVTEAKIDKVVVEGNKQFDEANIRASVPGIRSGVHPNVNKIGADLRLANENPSKLTTLVLRAGATESQVDGVIRVREEPTNRYSLSLDNTGNDSTGRYRLAFGAQFANLWNRDHVLTTQIVTSPEERAKLKGYSKDVLVLGLGYKIPLYSWGDSLEFTLGYSSVDSGVVQNLFNVAGQGNTFGVRYNLNLARIGDLEHKLIISQERKEFKNDVLSITNPGTGTLIPDITVNPFSLTYTGTWRKPTYEMGFYAGAHMNVPGGTDGAGPAFFRTRSTNSNALGAPSNYKLLRFGGNLGVALPQDMQLRAVVAGQLTRDMLVPGEQFGLGGADSIRGFTERQFSADSGFRATIEGYSPDFGKAFGVDGLKVRALVFHDTGVLRRRLPNPAEVLKTRLSSVGVGMRITWNNVLALRLDYAMIGKVGEVTSGNPPATPPNYRDSRWHGVLSYTF